MTVGRASRPSQRSSEGGMSRRSRSSPSAKPAAPRCPTRLQEGGVRGLGGQDRRRARLAARAGGGRGGAHSRPLPAPAFPEPAPRCGRDRGSVDATGGGVTPGRGLRGVPGREPARQARRSPPRRVDGRGDARPVADRPRGARLRHQARRADHYDCRDLRRERALRRPADLAHSGPLPGHSSALPARARRPRASPCPLLGKRSRPAVAIAPSPASYHPAVREAERWAVVRRREAG